MAPRNIDAGWATALATGLFNLAVAVFCRSAQDALGRHWLYGVQHNELPGVFIVWFVGLVFLLYGRRRGDAVEYMGFLFLLLSAVYAARICWFV